MSVDLGGFAGNMVHPDPTMMVSSQGKSEGFNYINTWTYQAAYIFDFAEVWFCFNMES